MKRSALIMVDPMRVTVLGAGEGLGAAVAKRAMAAGWAVTGLSPPGRAPESVRTVAGSVLDVAVLATAIEGADAVAWCVGGGPTGPALFRHTDSYSNGTTTLLAAMSVAKVRKLVAVTSLGLGETRGRAGFVFDRIVQPLILGAIFADKERQEDLIRASGVDWTIVRPAGLTDEPPTGQYHATVNPDEIRTGSISCADVAAFFLDCLQDDKWKRSIAMIGM